MRSNLATRVLLIQHHSPTTNRTVPLGLTYLAAVLEQVGAVVKVIDATAPYASYSLSDVVKEVERFRPHAVGLTIHSFFIKFAYQLVNSLKPLNTVIIVGGPHPTLFPEEVLNNGVDIVVRGEGEETIVEVLDWFNNKRALSDILGVSFKNSDGEIIHNAPRPLIKDLDKLPFPAKHLLNINDYVQNETDWWHYGGIYTSRGCSMCCTFCAQPITGRTYRFRSPENVLKEITFLHEQYKLNHFLFGDDTFTADKGRFNHMLNLLSEKKRDWQITWSCRTRVDHLDSDILKRMKETGCTGIELGIETGNDYTLKRIRKNITVEQAKRIVALAYEIGIDTILDFMYGFPWESAESLDNTIKLIKYCAQFSSQIAPVGILVPYPGTKIYEEFKDEYGFEGWWLREREFTGSYQMRLYSPLFRQQAFGFDDTGQLEGEGFFNYSKAIKRKIKEAANFIRKHNVKSQGFLAFYVVMLFNFLSKVTYRFSPEFERQVVQRLFYTILNIKKRGRKPRQR